MALAVVVTAVTVAAAFALVAVVTMAVTVMFVTVVIVLALVVDVGPLFALLLVAVEPSALDDLGGGPVLITACMMPAFIVAALTVLTLRRSLAFGLSLEFTIVLGIMAELRRARSRRIFRGFCWWGGGAGDCGTLFCVGRRGGLVRRVRLGTFLFQRHFAPRTRHNAHLLPNWRWRRRNGRRRLVLVIELQRLPSLSPQRGFRIVVPALRTLDWRAVGQIQNALVSRIR